MDFYVDKDIVDHIALPLKQGVEDEAESYIRKQILQKLGLNWDPFVTPVSEQEFLFASSPTDGSRMPEATVLSYFIPPKKPNTSTQPVLSALSQANLAFVYGNPGQGKTSLRLAFEAQCRRLENPAMVVLYKMGPDMKQVQTAEDHWQMLARQLAIDLFIQIAERFQPEVDEISESQVCALAEQIGFGGRPLQRLVARIIEEPEPEGSLGIGQRWPSVGRLAVRYVAKSPALIKLLKKVQSRSVQFKQASPYGWEQLLRGVEAAHTWNFNHIYILVDGVDNWQRKNEEMFHLVEPLIRNTAKLQKLDLYGKYFLPKSIQVPTENLWQGEPKSYTLVLIWDDEALKKLLQARFRAAGSRRKGFNDLATDEFDTPLDDLLIQQAQGSPRRLLNFASALIDETAVANLQTEDDTLPKISPQIWHNIVQNALPK